MTNEIQLSLAEKRTALSLLRTGIAVCALPMSVLGLLGCYLMLRAVMQVHRCDAMVRKLKLRYHAIAMLLD